MELLNHAYYPERSDLIGTFQANCRSPKSLVHLNLLDDFISDLSWFEQRGLGPCKSTEVTMHGIMRYRISSTLVNHAKTFYNLAIVNNT